MSARRRSRWLPLLLVGVAGCAPPASEPDNANPFGTEAGSTPTTDPGESDGGSTDPLEGGEGPATTAPQTTTTSSDDESTSGAPASSSEESSSGAGENGEASTSSSEGGESSSSESGVGETSSDGTVDVSVSVQSMWQDGECDDVTVTNVSAMTVMWQIDLALPGTITMLWNAVETTEVAGVGTFVGVDFNGTLDPGEAAMWGFCVDY